MATVTGFGLAGSSLATVTGFGLRLAAVTESERKSGLVWLQLQGLAPDLSDLRILKKQSMIIF